MNNPRFKLEYHEPQIHLLRLHASVVTVPRSHPAARARYIDAPPLTLLPFSLLDLLASPRTPALRSLLPALLREPFKPANSPLKSSSKANSHSSIAGNYEDESVHDFVSRRFGPEFARLFLSAFIHGIYATDARALSVRAAFPFLVDAERRGRGSVVRGFVRDALFPPANKDKDYSKAQGEGEYEVGEVDKLLKDAAMFTFRNGIETLSKALVADLRARPNVQLRTGVEVRHIAPLSEEIQVSLAFYTFFLSFFLLASFRLSFAKYGVLNEYNNRSTQQEDKRRHTRISSPPSHSPYYTPSSRPTRLTLPSPPPLLPQPSKRQT